MTDECAGSCVVSTFLLAGSQRNETPFARRASATGGNTVRRAVSSTRKVSTLLHAAGYDVFESTNTLTAIAGSAVCSRYIEQRPSA